ATAVLKQREPLFEKHHITEEELNDLKAAVDRATAEQARSKAALSLAEKAQADSLVRPSISGVINSRRVSKGEYVEAKTVIASIVDLSELRVRFVIPETESAAIRPEAEVNFQSRATGVQAVKG